MGLSLEVQGRLRNSRAWDGPILSLSCFLKRSAVQCCPAVDVSFQGGKGGPWPVLTLEKESLCLQCLYV